MAVTENDKNIPTPVEDPFQDRRNDYDVTNTVKVSSPRAVRRAVKKIYESLFPQSSFDPLWFAFHDFERLFYGYCPNYYAVDTTYHDVQHTLDMTLAAARLVSGYERSVEDKDQLGPARAQLGIVCSLFHDFGYLRHKIHDNSARNGAEFTRSHVTRSGTFLESYLPSMGLEEFVPIVARIVHFTGYEIHPDEIELENPKDCMVGHLIGTADLLAQIADRCYLEKCRDRLYPEFVLGDIAIEREGDSASVRYADGNDLLAKTLDFFRGSAQQRLDQTFNKSYRYLEAFFETGDNPYVYCIRKNLTFLRQVIETDGWDRLRRRPPCEVPDPDAVSNVISLARQHVKEISESGVVIRGRIDNSESGDSAPEFFA